MSAILTLMLTFIESMLPTLASMAPAAIAKIIADIEVALPILVKEAPAMVGPIQNLIESLGSNPGTSDEQMARLDAMDAQCDAALDAANADFQTRAAAAANGSAT